MINMNDMSVKVIFESKLAYLPILRKAVRGICSSIIENNEEFLQDIDLCLNEALSNVICHAYQNEPGHEIQVIVALYSHEIMIQIIDIGLKNTNTEKPIESEHIDEIPNLSETGRGLLLMHQLMDEVTYKTEKEKNILILRKTF